MDAFNEQLRICREHVARQKKLRGMLDELYDRRRALQKQERQLAAERQEEQRDVDRLEGHRLAALFYTLTGQKGEKLDEEQKQAYAAVLKHDRAVCELAATEQDIQTYEQELAALRGCEKRYDEAVAAKADALKRSNPSYAQQLLRLEERIAACKAEQTEIEEAMAAGRTAQGTADAILSHLDGAERLGQWDIFTNSFLLDLSKHSRLDEGQGKVELLQRQLSRFKTELSDIAVHADIQVQIDGFLRFADYFFDGLFADFAVLDRIRDSKGQVSETRNRIVNVLNKLSALQTAYEESLKTAKAEREELILRA